MTYHCQIWGRWVLYRWMPNLRLCLTTSHEFDGCLQGIEIPNLPALSQCLMHKWRIMSMDQKLALCYLWRQHSVCLQMHLACFENLSKNLWSSLMKTLLYRISRMSDCSHIRTEVFHAVYKSPGPCPQSQWCLPYGLSPIYHHCSSYGSSTMAMCWNPSVSE